MGEIIFWGIIRTAIVIPSLWILYYYIDYSFWWTLSFLSIYVVIIHPAIIQYHLFMMKNKDVIESTLCSSCKYFEETAVLCSKHDEHPTKDFLPCEGIDWVPKSNENLSEEKVE